MLQVSFCHIKNLDCAPLLSWALEIIETALVRMICGFLPNIVAKNVLKGQTKLSAVSSYKSATPKIVVLL
jgi:hypothetical protein